MMLNGAVLAQAETGRIGAGALSLVVLLLMGVATAALIWNMNGRLKKLPSSFAPPATDVAQSPEEKREDPSDS